METLEMLSKVYGESAIMRSKVGIGVLNRADNPSKTMNMLDDRLHGTREMLCWCLNVFEKIVVKHLHKLQKIHTS
ncbi:hypothetical protein TNCV_3111411 [Trichonephila clavipes]|nr:hypothetical protein TNCV_3111411 [Trichonephila clavipes]